MANVKVDLRSLLCINNSDEFGIAETDEVLVFHRSFTEGAHLPEWSRFRKENVDDKEWAIKASKPLTLWHGNLAPGASLIVQCIVAEEGGGGLPGDILAMLGGLVGPGIDIAVKLLAEKNADYIGGFQIKLSMSDKTLLKSLQCQQRSKVAGYKEWGHLSKTGQTLRVRMRHTLPVDNVVDYHASINVWNLDQSTSEALVWKAQEGSTTAS